MIHNMENIEEIINDLEKYIPTPEYIKERANIDVISIKKYFPQVYRAKRITISGAYIIFTMSKDKYISSSRDVLDNIGLYKTKNILVVYIYETDYINAKNLEFWLHKLTLESDNILPKIIEDIIQEDFPKNICTGDIIPKNIGIIRCIDNITIDDIRYIHQIPGTYILQFTDGECYVGSSTNLRRRLMMHKYRLLNFISRISMCETQNIIDASILETIFINMLKPKYNRIRGLDNGNMQSINIQYKRGRNRLFREKKYQFIAISKDISELLEKKMIKLFERGMFSISIQKLTESAIKKGLEIISDNIVNISDKGSDKGTYQYRYQHKFQFEYQQYQQFECQHQYEYRQD
jgi:hypothetical protein